MLSLSFSYSSNLQCSYAQKSLKNTKKHNNQDGNEFRLKLAAQAFFHLCDNFLLPVLVGSVSGLKMILIYPENWFPMNKLADLSREAQ